ncbi:MAG: class I tRNA ligase family protein [Anaeroplasma sp.]|nr:class I tRNA ligase family protein [Anaeroplasma sp.]
MEREYWIEKWQKDNDFSIENDRLREKSFIFASFPKANMFGFQSLGFRHLIYADAYARYQRFQNKNVLFPVGIHSLCNTSFLENKKLSSALNDDISKIFKEQMEKLGIGINNAKFIDMRHNEYLSLLQQSFIDFYEKGHIFYKDTVVYYDKNNNKIYDYMNKTKTSTKSMRKCFVLDVKKYIPRILECIDELKLSLEYKEMLKKSFDLKKVMKLNLNLSNGATLPIRLSDPEYIGGISYIFLNPEHIDITDYVDINEYSSVIAYLEDCHNETLFSFSGIYARNPLTGKEIPIFISTLYNQEVYLGIPAVDLDDKTLAIEQELEIIEILRNGVLINSDFLDDLDPSCAKEKVIDAFVEAEIAEIENEYENTEIVLSSLDTFGSLFPFLEEKDEDKITPLTGHLPYYFSAKMRPSFVDNVDIIGTTMAGTINNLYTEGMCPILSMLYDNIGSVISVFSDEAKTEYTDWNGIKLSCVYKDNIFSSILMPIIFMIILEDELNIEFINKIGQIEICGDSFDIRQKEIKRSNNNMVDFERILNEYSSDSIRYFSLLDDLNNPFVFDTYRLSDINKKLEDLKNILREDKNASPLVDFQLFNLVKSCINEMDKMNVSAYVRSIDSFIDNYALKQGLSKKQIFTLIKLLFPITPFLAEDIYLEVFDGKYSLVNEEFPEE